MRHVYNISINELEELIGKGVISIDFLHEVKDGKGYLTILPEDANRNVNMQSGIKLNSLEKKAG